MTEKDYIVSQLNRKLSKPLERFEDFSLGEFCGLCDQLGCYELEGKWFTYRTDEKGNTDYRGPFSADEAVYQCALLLGESSKFEDLAVKDEERYRVHSFSSDKAIRSYLEQKKSLQLSLEEAREFYFSYSGNQMQMAAENPAKSDLLHEDPQISAAVDSWSKELLEKEFEKVRSSGDSSLLPDLLCMVEADSYDAFAEILPNFQFESDRERTKFAITMLGRSQNIINYGPVFDMIETGHTEAAKKTLAFLYELLKEAVENGDAKAEGMREKCRAFNAQYRLGLDF